MINEDTPELRQQILEELENIKNGTPSLGWVNTMGKREKKSLEGFTRKGSRLISFYDISMRIAEQMIFGDLMDQLSNRRNLLTSVGHMNPIDYFELINQEECDAGRGVEKGLSSFLHFISFIRMERRPAETRKQPKSMLANSVTS